MGLFGDKPKAGGFMDVIRCDEPSYLIWKWHPEGSEKGFNRRENAIRWGSSLRVKDGEVAVFVYTSKNGETSQDFIEGPMDCMIKTANLPVLINILGAAYNGDTPFQAEVYFINMARIIQIPFAVPYFDLYDPRYLDFGVPTAVRGKISFGISDYREFIKLHRLIDFNLEDFQNQIKEAVSRYTKDVVANVPMEKNIPVVQIEREIGLVSDVVEANTKERLERDFGVNVSGVDINVIDVDKTSEGYRQLKAVTADLAAATAQAQTEINIKNMQDMQQINAENMAETLRIQREETQYAQHKQTQSSNLDAFRVEQQARVGIAGAEALGNMANNGATEMPGGGSGGMNPVGLMTGMAMGGAIGQNMAGMMNNMMSGLNGQPATGANASVKSGITPPPIPSVGYHVVLDGQDAGAYTISSMTQMVSIGTLTKDTLVWKEGMSEWVKAGEVQELDPIWGSNQQTPPPIPTE